MTNILSVNTTFFTVLNYPMSYIEFFGTVLNLACVWLVMKNKVLNWPVGILGTILFGLLFYQIQLYSDFLEQIYYFITGFYGWWLWNRLGAASKKEELKISHTSFLTILTYGGIIIAGTILLGFIMGRINLWFPTFFPEPAAFPFLDAFTTVMSFAAQILLAQKKVENWYLWIIVDIIGIGLYFAKGVIFISLLYFLFLMLATNGLFSWRKIVTSSSKNI